LSRCHSMEDLAQLQSTFLTRMAADYSMEARQLAQNLQELCTNWMTASQCLLSPEKPTRH
ncbi:MAG: hypothetical protein ACHP79_08695, partial [Terriglobales bacterium]